MKRSLIFFAIVLVATVSVYLIDRSRLRAEDGDGFPDDLDNVELAIPPTSPDAVKYYDGVAIISYDPDDDSDPSTAVSGRAEDGKTDKLPGLQPDQIVKVKLQLGANRADRHFRAAALDGGKIIDAEDELVADDAGNLSFQFQVGHEPGLYQIALNDGTHEIGVHFWVINNENPEDNPKVDLPEDPIAITASPETTATPPANDNPAGPCGVFNPNVTTGCSFDPYTANGGPRSITDLAVPGAVGMYPLAFTRTLNTRYVSGLQSEFGTAGNWRHSYQWSVEGSDFNNQNLPQTYRVNYPDGRRVEFIRRSYSDDDYFRGPRGVRDRFQQLKNEQGFSTSECYLLLPDGGRVHFHASPAVGGGLNFQLVEVIDPYGQSQTITYPQRQSMTVQEPAGRQLNIFYTTISNTVVVTRVEHWSAPPENGGVRVQSVYYGYVEFGNSIALNAVKYPDGTTARYTYQNSNFSSESARPLIRTCIDPMFVGPMWKIAYSFVQGGSTYGQLQSENYFDGVNVGPAVSTLAITGTLTRGETRGDDPTNSGTNPSRTFTYWGNSSTPDPQNFSIRLSGRPYEFKNASDFKGDNTSFMAYDDEGFVSVQYDRNANRTDYTNNSWTGNPKIIEYPLCTACVPAPVRPGTRICYPGAAACTPEPNNNDARNPYYPLAMVGGKKPGKKGRGRFIYSAQYERYPNKQIKATYYPDKLKFDGGTGESETYNYDQFGRVTRHQMRTGGIEQFVYDDRGLLREYYDAEHRRVGSDSGTFDGPSVRYEYYPDPTNPATIAWTDRIWKTTDARGNATEFTYNARGQVLTTKPPDAAQPVRNVYNGNGTLASTTDELGNTTSYTYDDYKRILTSTLPAPAPGQSPSITIFSYVPVGGTSPAQYTHTDAQPTRVVSPKEKVVQTIYDENLRKWKVTIAPGTADEATTTFGYDRNGNQKTVEDAKHNVTTYFYDTQDRLFAMDDPNPTHHTNSDGEHSTTWRYDGYGNLKKITRGNDQVTEHFYQFEQPTCHGGFCPPPLFPERVTWTRVNQGPSTPEARMAYDYYRPGQGNGQIGLLRMYNPGSGQHFYSYDRMGRKTNLEYPIASGSGTRKAESWTYDTAGNLATFMNRKGDVQHFDLADSYDSRNRLQHFNWSNNAAPEQWIDYDDASRVTEIRNTHATIKNHYFDDNTLQSQEEWAADENVPRTVNYTYYPDQSLRTIAYPNSHALEYNYTNRNQIASIQDLTDSHFPVAYGLYDLNGNVVNSTIGGVVANHDLDYDPGNMCLQISRYFQQGEASQRERTFRYQYDMMNDRTRINQDEAIPSLKNHAIHTYDLSEQSTTEEIYFGSQLQRRRTLYYDSNGNRTGSVGQFATNQLNQYTVFEAQPVEYDENGNLKVAPAVGDPPPPAPGPVASPSYYPSESPEPNCFQSPRDVTITTATAGAQIRYTTNGADPRTGGTVIASGDSVELTFTASGVRLKAVAFTDFAQSAVHDERYLICPSPTPCGGCPGTDAPAFTYTYDAQNRLVSTSNGSTTQTFKYDGLSRQISYTLNGVTTYNVWHGWNLIEEWTRPVGASTSTLTYSYIYGARGEIVERIRHGDGQRLLYFQDAIGNTSHVADSAGHLLEQYKYTRTGTPSFYGPDGSPRDESALGVRHLFHGQLWTQETGLNDYRNRMQLPTMGVFMQPDPIGFDGDPTNLYRFCGNSAVNFTDRLGLWRGSSIIRGGITGLSAGITTQYISWWEGNGFNWAGVGWATVQGMSIGAIPAIIGVPEPPLTAPELVAEVYAGAVGAVYAHGRIGPFRAGWPDVPRREFGGPINPFQGIPLSSEASRVLQDRGYYTYSEGNKIRTYYDPKTGGLWGDADRQVAVGLPPGDDIAENEDDPAGDTVTVAVVVVDGSFSSGLAGVPFAAAWWGSGYDPSYLRQPQ